MAMYFVVFAIVLFFSYIASIQYKKENKSYKFFIFLSILTLSLFAALRHYSVGKDIEVYALSDFMSVKNQKSIVSVFTSFGSERLYYLFDYVISKLFGNFRFFLFFHQFIISLLVYKIALSEKNKGNFLLYIFSYLLLTYNLTFNIIRQSLSIFIVLYSYKYLESRENIKYVIGVIIASMFHTSALICLLFPFIRIVSSWKHKYFYIIVTSTVIIISYYYLNSILNFVGNNFSAFRHYSHYIDIFDKTNLSKLYLYTKIFMMMFFLFFSSYVCKIDRKNKNNSFLIYMCILDVVLFYACAFVKYGYRFSYYFYAFNIYFIPRLYNTIQNKFNKKVYILLVVVILITHWVIRNVIVGYDSTVPYLFG